MTDSQRSLSKTLMHQSSHATQKALTRVILDNNTLLINDQFPPCKVCQGAMRFYTLNNQAKIVYQWLEKRGERIIAQTNVWQNGQKIQKRIK